MRCSLRKFRVAFSDRPDSTIYVDGRVPKRVVYSALAARGSDTRRITVFHTREPSQFYVRMVPGSSDHITAVVTECSVEEKMRFAAAPTGDSSHG